MTGYQRFSMMGEEPPDMAAWLAEIKGGKWIYDNSAGLATWFCDDGKRSVSRVAVGEIPVYHLHGPDGTEFIQFH